MLSKILLIFIISIFASAISVSAQTKEIKKCKSMEKGGKYKIVFTGRLLDERGTVYSYIIVKPKNFNREHMLQVARRLKSEYCNEEKLLVSIFDNQEFAGSESLLIYANSGGKIIRTRGYYSFDKAKKTELLEFSTKLGNSTAEVYINLSSNP